MNINDASISANVRVRLERYVTLLLKWNQHINLVSARDEGLLWDRHVADSLRLLPYISPAATLTDMGSGGGFPAIPVAIANGNACTMIESDQRKCAFLREAARLCELNAHVVPSRLEAAQLAPADVLTARALAPLTQLLSWAQTFLKPDGAALFLKGKNYADELREARHSWRMNARIYHDPAQSDGVILHISELARD